MLEELLLPITSLIVSITVLVYAHKSRIKAKQKRDSYFNTTNQVIQLCKGKNMKQKTSRLYRQDPHKWAKMTYKDALIYRIKSAKEAMDFYRIESEKHISGDYKIYESFVNKFRQSEKTKEFNIKLLEEVT